MKKLLLTALSSLVLIPAFSQGWKKTYTSSQGNPVYLSDVKSLPNGGIIAVGGVSAAENNAVMMRCDQQGNVLWAKVYDSGLIDNAGKVVLYPGGGYVVYANQFDTTSLNDNNVIFRTDTSGNILWSYGFIGNGIFTVQEIEVTTSGKILFTGNTANCPNSFGCAYAAALSGAGSLLWANSIEGNFVTTLNDLIYSSDNQLVVAGAVVDSITFTESGFAAKLDTTGNLTWANTYGGSFTSDRFYAVTENADLQGYVLVGSTLSSPSANFDAHMLTCNYTGNYQSSGFAGGIDNDEAKQVFTINGTNVFIGGYSESGSGVNIHEQGLNASLDISNGNITNAALMGVNTDDEIVQSAVLGSQGEIIQALKKNPFSISGNIDFLLSKSITTGSVCNETTTNFTTNLSNYLDNFGAITTPVTLNAGGTTFNTSATVVSSANGCVNVGIEESANAVRFTLYPNPAHDFLMIDGDFTTGCPLIISDARGAIAVQQQLPAGRSVVDIRSLSAGFYTASLTINGTTAVQKFVVTR